MTKFTTSDRENAKLVEEAPYHPGYEDAVVYPTVIVDSGASVDDREDSMQMLRDQIHTQQCEINALRKALMYANPKKLTDEEILDSVWLINLISNMPESPTNEELFNFAYKAIRKAQEK